VDLEQEMRLRSTDFVLGTSGGVYKSCQRRSDDIEIKRDVDSRD